MFSIRNLIARLRSPSGQILCGRGIRFADNLRRQAHGRFRNGDADYITPESVIGILSAVRSGMTFWRPLTCDYRVLHPYLRFGGPLVLNGIAYWVLSLSDRCFLSIRASTDDTANYILSDQLAGSIVQYPMSF